MNVAIVKITNTTHFFGTNTININRNTITIHNTVGSGAFIYIDRLTMLNDFSDKTYLSTYGWTQEGHSFVNVDDNSFSLANSLYPVAALDITYSESDDLQRYKGFLSFTGNQINVSSIDTTGGVLSSSTLGVSTIKIQNNVVFSNYQYFIRFISGFYGVDVSISSNAFHSTSDWMNTTFMYVYGYYVLGNSYVITDNQITANAVSPTFIPLFLEVEIVIVIYSDQHSLFICGNTLSGVDAATPVDQLLSTRLLSWLTNYSLDVCTIPTTTSQPTTSQPSSIATFPTTTAPTASTTASAVTTITSPASSSISAAALPMATRTTYAVPTSSAMPTHIATLVMGWLLALIILM